MILLHVFSKMHVFPEPDGPNKTVTVFTFD